MTMQDNLIKNYLNDHPQSGEWHERAKKVFTANGATHFARVMDPYRPYVTHTDGCKKYDLDGNEYIDYVMGHGALLLGHNNSAVVDTVREQVVKGVLYGENHRLEVEWAELIQDMMPSAERVLFFSCGNEANMMAIRLSRVLTGRKKILRFEKHYHGWADEMASPAEPGVNQDHVVVIPHNDLQRLEEELAKEEYAILFTEGGGAFLGGRVPLNPEFVRRIPELTKKYGTVWLLDEVVTGFRYAPGGWQGIIGVKPDLTTLGKCVSGGLNAGVLVGRKEIFEPLNPNSPTGKRVIHGGTWNANPLSASAGVAACRILKTGDPQRKASALAALLRREGNRLLKEKNVEGGFYGPHSIIYLYLGPVDWQSDDGRSPVENESKLSDPAKAPVFERLMIHLLQRGIASLMGQVYIFSAEHTEIDVQKTIEALGESFDDLINEGLLEK